MHLFRLIRPRTLPLSPEKDLEKGSKRKSLLLRLKKEEKIVKKVNKELTSRKLKLLYAIKYKRKDK